MSKLNAEGYPINYERLNSRRCDVKSVIAAHLFKAPQGDEGYSTKMRSKIVSREHSLNELGKDKSHSLIDSKVPIQHFGENIHG
jgi:ribonuclease-3